MSADGFLVPSEGGVPLPLFPFPAFTSADQNRWGYAVLVGTFQGPHKSGTHAASLISLVALAI
jgi:hypothetical protein